MLQKHICWIVSCKKWSVQGTMKKKKVCSAFTAGPQHQPLHSRDLCLSSLPINRACQGMVADLKDKMYNPTSFYTTKLPFLLQKLYLILACQRWQSIAIAVQKRILWMFQTLKEVEMYLLSALITWVEDKVTRQKHSVIYLMLHLHALKRIEHNKFKKDSDTGTSLDGSFCGREMSWLCIASTEYNT